MSTTRQTTNLTSMRNVIYQSPSLTVYGSGGKLIAEFKNEDSANYGTAPKRAEAYNP